MSHNFGFIPRETMLERVGQPSDQSEILLDVREGVGPLFAADAVFSIVGNAVTVIRPADNARIVSLTVEFGGFTFRTGDQLVRTIDVVRTDGLTGLVVSGHGYSNVDGPVRVSTTVTLPAGLDANVLYFLEALSVDSLRLHTTRESAELGDLGDALVTITDTGNGTHTLGGMAAEAVVTDSVIGDNITTINVGEGQALNEIFPQTRHYQAGVITVSGFETDSRMKWAVRE